MTSKSKIGYYFQQAANPGKGVPRENDQNEHSKSVSTATEKESDVNEDKLLQHLQVWNRMKHA